MDESEADEIELYPAWREVIKLFLDGNRDEVLTYEWLYEHFRIAMPHAQMQYDDACKSDLAFLKAWKMCEDIFLVEHNIAFRNIRGIGYQAVPSADQTDWADKNNNDEIKKAFKKGLRRLKYVDLLKLTPDQRQHNADAMVRLSGLRSLLKINNKTQLID